MDNKKKKTNSKINKKPELKTSKKPELKINKKKEDQKSFFDKLQGKANDGLKIGNKKKIHILDNIKKHEEGHKTKAKYVPYDPNRTNTKVIGKISLPNFLTLFRLFMVIPFIILLGMPLFFDGNNAVAGGFAPSGGTGFATNIPSYSFLNWQIYCFIAAGLIFVLAMITDYFDGKIARNRNQVTTFGKCFDPIADKIMTTTALVMLSIYGIIPFYLSIIIICRDLIVDGLRTVASINGVVVPASKTAKWKTMVISVAIILIFFITPAWSYWSTRYHFFSPYFPGIAGWIQKVKGSIDPTSHVSVHLMWLGNWLLIAPLTVGALLSIISGVGYFNKVKKFISMRPENNDSKKNK